MASLIVRNLDEEVKARLAERARQNGVSMEAEVRQILTDSVGYQNAGKVLIEVLANTGDFPEFSVTPRELDDDRIPFV